jgi:membrane protein implicated in regulation of membrane protease activity
MLDAMNKKSLVLISALALCALGSPALAYIGPGVGAGAVAAVFGVLGSIFLAIVGVVYYPIKRLLKKRKAPSSGADEREESA